MMRNEARLERGRGEVAEVERVQTAGNQFMLRRKTELHKNRPPGKSSFPRKTGMILPQPFNPMDDNRFAQYMLACSSTLLLSNGVSVGCKQHTDYGLSAFFSSRTPVDVGHQEADWLSIHNRVCQMLVAVRTPAPFHSLQADRDQHRAEIREAQEELICVCEEECRRWLFEGQCVEALPAARLCLRIAMETHGANAIQLVPAYLLLAEANVGLGNLPLAQEYLSQAEWTVLKTPDCSGALRHRLHRNLGSLYQTTGQLDTAVMHYANDVYYASEEYGLDSIVTCGGYFLMASVFQRQNKTDIVSSLYKKVADSWHGYLSNLMESRMKLSVHQTLSGEGEGNLQTPLQEGGSAMEGNGEEAQANSGGDVATVEAVPELAEVKEQASAAAGAPRESCTGEEAGVANSANGDYGGESVPKASGDVGLLQSEEEGEEDDTCSEMSDVSDVSQLSKDQLYPLEDIITFLDDTYGRSVDVQDFFSDLDKFEASRLEEEISKMEVGEGQNNVGDINEKKKELRSFLQEQAKGALVRARISSIKDMDAPTSYFFNLEKKALHQKHMAFLKRDDGTVTTNQSEIRDMAIHFYENLYGKSDCDLRCAERLVQGLPMLSLEGGRTLDQPITFQELTEAVQQMSKGRAPRIDGLPADFYQHFWGTLGRDYFEMLQECIKEGQLPTSSRRAVLSLLPKKGDLGLLKNWRPVSLLCEVERCEGDRTLTVMLEEQQKMKAGPSPSHAHLDFSPAQLLHALAMLWSLAGSWTKAPRSPSTPPPKVPPHPLQMPPSMAVSPQDKY
ncbi:hypothetical protein ACEWY4_000096 [Coilia grayii]|uniref:Uncharacterized protein n=1 Tax=Coilia grayii TaxID=363190 RepID=A0ABD1KVN8_9TELE